MAVRMSWPWWMAAATCMTGCRSRRRGSGYRKPESDATLQPYATFGSLNASISPSYSLIGKQLQNTFLSP